MSGDQVPSATIRHRLTQSLPRARVPGLPALSMPTRIMLLVFGWLMILLGVLGLFFPVLQGVLFLAIGAACLSLVSRFWLTVLRFLMRPWPRGWRAFLRTRRRLLRWILETSGDDLLSQIRAIFSKMTNRRGSQ